MNRQFRKQLTIRYRGKIDAAVQKALSEVALPTSDIQELEGYAMLMNLSEPRWKRDSGAAIVVAVVCIAVAALLWTTKVPHTSITLSAMTESLQGTLAEDWHVDNPFQSQLMHFERLSSIHAPNLGLSIKDDQGNAWVKLQGGKIALASLDIDKGASVHMSADKSEVNVFVSLTSIRGRITVVGKGKLTAGTGPDQTVTQSYDLPIPETIEFATNDPRDIPSRMTMHGPQNWDLGKVPLANFNFALEQVRGLAESEFTSGAKSGSIRFNDTSWSTYEISENELVAVHETDQAAVDVRNGDPLIHVTLNGTVQNVSVGHSSTSTKLAPSYLEYLYNKKTLAFFWGAVVFVWGILWGIRRTIFQ
jgi:hypothetical protein